MQTLCGVINNMSVAVEPVSITLHMELCAVMNRARSVLSMMLHSYQFGRQFFVIAFHESEQDVVKRPRWLAGSSVIDLL